MTSRPRALLSFSSGKDSAYALHVLREQDEVEVVGLFTTVNEAYDRVAMHAVRRDVLRAQAASIGLPLWEVDLPNPCSNEQYEARMRGLVERARAHGVEVMAFGDLFLEDIRRYREERLAGSGVRPIFPIFGRNTRELAETLIASGFSAVLTTVDPKKLPGELAGRRYDRRLLAELPEDVDPCGENGEFHTLVTHGPIFRVPIETEVGPRVERDGFVYCDVTLRSGGAQASSPAQGEFELSSARHET